MARTWVQNRCESDYLDEAIIYTTAARCQGWVAGVWVERVYRGQTFNSWNNKGWSKVTCPTGLKIGESWLETELYW